ncbi:hypothetical protein H7F51_05790 [Novosphingobium flavum]|uniref:PRC-barrel domain-containing protein n=1 Tax=Novosphingobium flavum TaxID=1778672 RepID=A0A7X1FQC4_9SPHN|nr:hypothetical protein [Novosphingobium flavum]MBC2665020.1 hypothetical protein [Novosphingobium flavum]
MNFKHILVALSFAAAGPALAQTAQVAVTAGATVYGPQGDVVGTVEKISGASAIVNTGKHSAALPTSAFGKNDKGLLVSMSKDQLDAAVEAAEAKASGALDTALVAGAAVHSSDGQPMGSVKAISADGVVTIAREGGEFSLRKDAFTTDANGVALRNTKAAIDEAVAKQAPAAASAPAAL